MDRKIFPAAIALGAAVASLAGVAAAAGKKGTSAGGAKEVEAAWMKAMKAGDVDAVVACYAPDATLWIPGQPEADGKDAIRAAYAGLLGANVVTAVSTSKEKYRGTADFGAGWGRWTMTLTPKAGGAPTTMHGRFTEVVEKRSGKWVYLADHASEDPPATTPPSK